MDCDNYLGGFSFCGVDIADLDLMYAPDQQNTFVFGQTAYKMNEQIFEAHDGGYYYGATAQPKDFSLRCVYLNEHVILSGLMTKVNDLFRIGRSGRLIFDKRPWCWYNATVTNVDTKQMMNATNGVITITMRAYYPFSRTDKTQIDGEDDPYKEDLLVNSGVLVGTGCNLTKDFAASGAITGQQTFAILNPGTQLAKGCIEIAGTG